MTSNLLDGTADIVGDRLATDTVKSVITVRVDPISTSVTEFVQSFLAAAGDGLAGAKLYALLSVDSPVYRAGTWQLKDWEELDVFAGIQRQIHTSGADALPTFIAAQAISCVMEPDSETAVIWFEARELRSATPVVGALGVHTDGDWRVSWATLADRRYEWTFADGVAQTLANFSWMNLKQPAVARTTLDAAYFRLHWLSDVTLNALAGTRFACRQGSTCCRQDYQIVVQTAAQSLIDSLPWERLAPRLRGTQLRAIDSDTMEVKGRNESCRFLGARNECLIHAELGYQPFGPCAAFPFSFSQTPDGVDVTASLTCSSVCESLGDPLAERDTDLRQRLAIAPVRATVAFNLAFETQVSWPAFRNAESLLLALLEQVEIPLHKRLHLGVRALDSLLAGKEFKLEIWRETKPPEISIDMREQIGGLLDNIMTWNRIAFRDLPKSVPRNLKHNDLGNASRLALILRALHFSKVYSYEHDLVTAHNFSIIIYLLALSWQRVFSTEFDDLRWRELALLGSHGLMNALLSEESPRAYRQLLGSPQFGEWALAFAAW